MNQDCCDKVLEYLDQLHKALAVKELLEKGFESPNKNLLPGARGYTKSKNYLEILAVAARERDYFGIHTPIEIEIEDINAARAGNQSVKLVYPTVTAAIAGIARLSRENKGDIAHLTNIGVRLAYGVSGLMASSEKIYRACLAIIEGLGIAVRDTKFEITLPFNPFVDRSGRGASKADNKLDLNEEDTTESLLPNLLKTHTYKIAAKQFKGGLLSINAMLVRLIAGKKG